MENNPPTAKLDIHILMLLFHLETHNHQFVPPKPGLPPRPPHCTLLQAFEKLLSACPESWCLCALVNMFCSHIHGSRLGGGGFVVTAQVIQWCRVPRLFQAHHSRSERLLLGTMLCRGQARAWILGGVSKNTHPEVVSA